MKNNDLANLLRDVLAGVHKKEDIQRAIKLLAARDAGDEFAARVIEATKPEAIAIAVPHVHLNGTSKAELLKQREEAYAALDSAYGAVKLAAPNGRDAYPVEGLLARLEAQHRDRLLAIDKVMRSLEAEIQAIDAQGETIREAAIKESAEEHVRFIVIAFGVWGGGATEAEAFANLKKNGKVAAADRIVVYRFSSRLPFVPFSEVRKPLETESEAYVSGDGAMCWTSDRTTRTEVYAGTLRGWKNRPVSV